jgi:predicted  nucleic acid-binding Zn-ribbon protein
MQAFFENLEVQMALGRKEFQDLWMHDMKNFRKFLHNEKFTLMDDSQQAKETWDNVLNAVDALDHTMDKLEEDIDKLWTKQKPALDLRINDLRKELASTGENVNHAFAEAWDRFRKAEKTTAREFHDEHPDAMSERMDMLKKKVQEFQQEFKEKLPDDEKLKAFRHEVSDSFDKMKKAFHDLFA